MTTSPPKEHNFDAIPRCTPIDEFFHRKYEEDEDTGKLRQVATAEEILAEQEAHADHHIHLPSPSYWPLVVAAGLPIVALGLIYNHVISIIGAVIVARRLLRLGAGALRRRRRGRRPDPTGRAARARSWRPLADVTLAPAVDGAHRHDIEPHHDHAVASRPTATRPPVCRTTSWPCGCSSARSACCSAA